MIRLPLPCLFGAFAAAMVLGGCTVREEVTEVWPNGAAKAVEYRNSKGELVKKEERHFNYLRHTVTPYKAGLPHGLYRSWRSDGSPEWSGLLERGKPTGEWILQIDRRGTVLLRGSFREGEKEGIWTSFHGNGEVREKGVWCRGAPCGEWETFDPEGRLVNRRSCWKGESNGTFLRFNREGRVELEYSCVDSLKHGKWSRYDFLGHLMEERHYRNDTLHGPLRTFFASGKPQTLVQYREGKREGEQLMFNGFGETLMACSLDNGTGRCIQKCDRHPDRVCADSVWKQGVLDGTVITWNLGREKKKEMWREGEVIRRSVYRVVPVISEGDTVDWKEFLSQEGELLDGEKNGIWKKWSSDGILLEESRYEKGELKGEQLIYDSTGTLAQKRIHHGDHRGITIEKIHSEQTNRFSIP